MGQKDQCFTLAELATLTNARLVGDPAHIIKGVADLQSALPQHASFLSNLRYEQAMRKSSAGVVFVDASISLSEGKNYLVAENPSRAFQQVIEAFSAFTKEITGFTGIHSSAVVHPTAKIGKDVSIGPLAVIDKGASIGDRTCIGAGSFVGLNVSIGDDCVLYPHVVVRERCTLGHRVILQPGSVVGLCGFGLTTNEKGQHKRLQQLGTVVLEDDVELGSNTVVERARFQVTRISQGTKIGSLVIVGHNSLIGQHNIIVSQAGLAGSSETGSHVTLAAQTGVAGHLKLADGVILTARASVSKSLPKGIYSGEHAMPLHKHNRLTVYSRKIEEYVKQIQVLQKRVDALESNCSAL